MEATEQIKILGEFFENNYINQIRQKIRKGEKFLVVDYSELLKFNHELAEELLDHPEEVIKAGEVALQEFELPEHMKNFRLRFSNLPESQKIMIRNIRSKHIEKLLLIEGVVRQKSDVRPQVTAAKFECPSCGNVISVLQLDSSFKEPNRCGCGRKGKFHLLSKELVDAQGLVLEEAPENLEGGEQPKRMNVFLKDDLVSPLSERKTNPGSNIQIMGQVKEVPIVLRTGAKSTRFDLLIEANFVGATEENFYDVEISEEEEKQILELSKDKKIYKKLISSIAPSIYGYEKVKEALLLQLMGGVQKERKDGVITRGDMHVLLVGDPGCGKSQMLKRISAVAPKGRYVSGKGVSGAGLTASVVKDEFLKGWSLEAGALVLASNGICCIDEMDKMGEEDRGAMHEALEQQTVSISKANIQATLLARTTVLAAANPKFGRFDPYDILAKQINLPPTLINRFDL
ncbi:minichromosome maintenance protein MCM, partial [Candidatus Woesearchaeota archaeon]|nr:minichromosome maintenance protein MCM [Candidatus Woesearchaeota archaeon]